MENRQTNVSPIPVMVTVVAFSDEATVCKCLESLLDQEFDEDRFDVKFRVIVNNPGAIDAQNISRDIPEFEYIVPRVNTGYAGTIHRCWRDAKDGIIIVTNDDLTFEPGWLENLIAPFSDEKVFATTCSVINEGEEEEKSNGTLNPLGIRIPDVFEDRTMVLFPSGAAFAFRKDDVEPLDSSFFLYFEDVFLGLKARMRGFGIEMNPESKVVHKHRLSTAKMSSLTLHYFQEKNRLANIYLIFQGWTFIRLLPYFIADLIIRLIQIVTFRRNPLGILGAWLYYLTHVGTTLYKRYKTGEVRKVSDIEILRMMSGKLLPGNSAIVRSINAIFLGYSKLVRLNFYEHTIKK
jgi:GT2 family glycosyltransferase